MKKYIFSAITVLFFTVSFSQSKEDVANDQKRKQQNEAKLKVPKEKPGFNKPVDKFKSIITVFEPITRMQLPHSNDGGSRKGNGASQLPKSKSNSYNSDGSANWGQQHNARFGCYLDALRGMIVDESEAVEIPGAVDLIFTAYKGTGVYYLFTPNFAHEGSMADAVWGSATTDNPVKSWKEVNETEVAETNITASGFYAIQNNNQLNSAVSKAKNWSGYVQIDNRLDNKVFALRVHLDNRKLFALILVQEHIGTDGSNGYLKIRIKVTGVDLNKDGEADTDAYETR